MAKEKQWTIDKQFETDILTRVDITNPNIAFIATVQYPK